MKYYNNKKRFFLHFVLLLISTISFAQSTPNPHFHDSKGNIDVNGSGQLQFALPIALPPGIKSVAPEVNLVYTSGSSNGVAGYGWNISGISSISRTGKNIEKDGEMKGIQLDYSDLYNFNGQRLVLKSGEYGKNGAEYVTEKFSNTKIKSVGSISGQLWNGPEYWEVTFADGSQAWYGAINSGNSSAITPTEYNIVKWKDAQSNYITYNYIQDAGSNVSIISSIKWGGNEVLGKVHFNEIIFNYNGIATRSLIEQSFSNGISFIQDKLLNNIVVNTNNSQYKKYVINYKTDNTTYQFVDKIQEYNSDNQPANPIEFVQDANTTGNSPVVGTPWSSFTDLVLSGNFRGSQSSLDFITYQNAAGSQPAGYFMNSYSTASYYLGSADVFKGAIPLTIKDGNNTVISRQGFVSYSINSTTKDLTLSYYLIDLSKPITYSQPASNYPNALQLVGTKVIAGTQWDESESHFDPYYSFYRITTIKKLIPYDIDADGVPEILIEKNNNTAYTICALPEDECEISIHDESKYFVIKQQDSFFPFFQFGLAKSENLIFGDFNGDGIDDIGRSSHPTTTIINGESVPQNILSAYNLKKDVQGNFSLSEVFSANYSGVPSLTQIGDFNGDGLSDVFAATNVNGHYIINLSTGKNFQRTPYFNHFNSTESYSNPQNGNHSVAKVLDINADGKSDIVNFSSSYNIASSTSASTTTTIRVSENHGYSNGSIQFVSDTPFQSTTNTPAIYREIVGLSQNGFYFYNPPSGNIVVNGYLYTYSHYSNLQRAVNRILQGGITTSINYNSTQNYYKPIKTEQYPLMELGNVNSQVVTSLYESGAAPNTSRFKEFRYRGLTINLHNKKTIGFRQMASSAWNSTIYPGNALFNIKIWSGVETEPLNYGAPVKEWTIRTNDESNVFPINISENNTQLLSFKSTTYQTDKLLNGQVVTTVSDADKAKVITAIIPKVSIAKDNLKGTTAESVVSYGEYYLPSQIISKINTSYATTTTNYLYSNNPSGSAANYYIGHQTSKTEVVQAYGDSKNGKEEFTYENNLVKTKKIWNRDHTGYILDTFTYDGFGNVIQQISSNSVDAQTITSGNEYDPKGIFVVKQTDNLGLQIENTYNHWGQILTKTDPFNNTVTNTYDNWGKLLTSTSNLGGTTTYLYERDNSNTIITKFEADGNVSKKYTNVLGQEYKSTTKAFGQGQFVSQETKYDLLGRKIMVSEPYFDGQSASQWNTISYNDNFYPNKITSTSFSGRQVETLTQNLTTTETEINGYGRITSKTTDALGNIISSTDTGGTINFAYNAAGEQIEAKYETNTVSTEYDSWGRKSEFNDPSNGVYTYDYDGFGKTKKTISPKGEKEYTYNNLGQLINQVELSYDGVSTIKNITFTYDNLGRLTLKSGTSNGKPYSLSFDYDTFGRITSSIENSNGRKYVQDKYDYDSLSRIRSYKKSLHSSGVLTEVTIVHMYNNWNGELYQLRDSKTGRLLWELENTNAKGQYLASKLGEATINNTYDNNGFLTNINHSSPGKPGILQIGYSFNAIKNELNSRTTGGDFTINENFEYDDNNRLASWTNPKTGQNSNNVYEIDGRIIENDQIGKVKYENSDKIYQATSVELNPAGVQNYNNDIIQYIGYNENNDPVYIDGLHGDVAFQYGLTSMRQRVTYGGIFNSSEDGEGRYTKLYSEDGSFEVTIDNETKSEKHILYIAGNPYESNILFVKNYKDSEGSYKFLHKDYLGSILAISDEKGHKIEQRHFDAWGNLTHLQIENGSVYTDENEIREVVMAQGGLFIDRGYTSHEHFTDVKIIHMNGRLYDPLLRRFLSADENIQDPSNTQNYNKYGYVMNNPMMYNDPNGEFWAWAIGTIVGSYLNGVQANNGNWNPVKWDWKNTWLSVVGGGIAGAAIGGGIQNIATSGTKFIANSVVGSVGGIFNGLANGQNIFKSALIGFSGINYTFNIGNRITSTDISDTPYGGFKTNSEEFSFAGLNQGLYQAKTSFNVYDGGEYIGKMKVAAYDPYTDIDTGEKGLHIELLFTSNSKKYSDYKWVQTVYTNNAFGSSNEYSVYNDLHKPYENKGPFYYAESDYIKYPQIKQGNQYLFTDTPMRGLQNFNIGWRGEVSLVGINKSGRAILSTFWYGFNYYSYDHLLLMPIVPKEYTNNYRWLKK